MAYRKTDRVREKMAGVRARLVDTSRQVVATDGFAGPKMAVLAVRAGVATGTVYRHFSNKAELCTEVFRHASQHELDVMAAALGGEGSAVERLERAVTLSCERAAEGRVLARALLVEPVDPTVEEARLMYRAAYAELIAVAIREGISAGELPDRDALTSARCAVGAMGQAVLGGDSSHIPSIVSFVMTAIRSS